MDGLKIGEPVSSERRRDDRQGEHIEDVVQGSPLKTPDGLSQDTIDYLERTAPGEKMYGGHNY